MNLTESNADQKMMDGIETDGSGGTSVQPKTINLRKQVLFSTLTLETILIIAAFFLGTILRFAQLGKAPLSDSEAVWANQAFLLSKTSPDLVIGPQPAYIILTSFIFSIFTDNEFTARFWPALAGSLLVLLPLLLKNKTAFLPMPPLVLILLSVGLAIDPGLVTVSRQVGGTMMALSFSALALASWFAGRQYLAGGFTGLALLSGPTFIPGAISLVVAAFFVFSRLKLTGDQQKKDPASIKMPALSKYFSLRSLPYRHFVLAAIFTFILVGTGFLQYPQGIAAWLSSIQIYFQGWLLPETISPLKIILAFLVYELFPIVFYTTGFARSIIERKIISPHLFLFLTFALLWSGISFLLLLFYPGRQVADLIWCVAPVWIIATWEIASGFPGAQEWTLLRGKKPKQDLPADRHQSMLGENPLTASFVLSIFIFIIMALFWFTLSTLSQQSIQPSFSNTSSLVNYRWFVPAGIIVLIILTSGLVSLGWSPRTGKQGLYWGITLALFVYNISFLWGSTYLRTNQPQEFWSNSPGTGQVRLLQETIDWFSMKVTGFSGYLDLVSTVDTSSLRWLLRNNQSASFAIEPPRGASPSAIITWADQEDPVLSAAYSGQDFVWWRWSGWEDDLPPNFLRWFTYRESPVFNQDIILWVRADLVQESEDATFSEIDEEPVIEP